MVENTETEASTADELLDGIEERGRDVATAAMSDREIYVSMEKGMRYFDRICTIAYDHGWVPWGVYGDASFFVPREDF
jgi:hypothetical protein